MKAVSGTTLRYRLWHLLNERGPMTEYDAAKLIGENVRRVKSGLGDMQQAKQVRHLHGDKPRKWERIKNAEPKARKPPAEYERKRAKPPMQRLDFTIPALERAWPERA